MNHNHTMVKKITVEQEGNQALALLIRHAIQESGILGKDIATLCKVKPQSVSNWKSTGRIGKENLEKLADITGKPLAYFSTLKKQTYDKPVLNAYAEHEGSHTTQLSINDHPLHYGSLTDGPVKTPQGHPVKNAGNLSPELIDLAWKIFQLLPHRRRLIEELIDQLRLNPG